MSQRCSAHFRDQGLFVFCVYTEEKGRAESPFRKTMRRFILTAGAAVLAAVTAATPVYAGKVNLYPDSVSADSRDSTAVHRAPQLSADSIRSGGNAVTANHYDRYQTGGGNSLHMKLKTLNILGMPEIAQSELQQEVKNLIGREIDAVLLRKVLFQLSTYCRDAGYGTVSAFYPEQQIEEGVITVYLLSGRLGRVCFNNDTATDDSSIEFLLAKVREFEGSKIREKDLESRLLKLSDLGIFDITGSFTPAAEDGTVSDLNLKITPAADRFSFSLFADNSGNEYSGEYRFGAQSVIRNLTGSADSLTLFAAHTDHSQFDWALGYEIPVSAHPAVLGFEISGGSYKLSGPYREIGAEGRSVTADAYVKFPLYRDLSIKADLQTGLRYRRLSDSFSVFDLEFKKYSYAGFADISVLYAPYKGTAIDASLRITAGKMNAEDEYSFTEDGSFCISSGEFVLQHSSGNGLTFKNRTVLQYTTGEPDGADSFNAGGFGALGGFDRTALAGDSGLMNRSTLYFEPFASGENFMLRFGPYAGFGAAYTEGEAARAVSAGVTGELYIQGLYLGCEISTALHKPDFAEDDGTVLFTAGYSF